MAKKKFQTHITPPGIAVYPWLNKPDTKFDPDGIFSVKLVFSKAATKKVSDVVKPLMNGGKNNPIKPEVDDQGEKTGNYVVNFKMKAHVKTKGGDEFDQKPVLVDSNGNRMLAAIGGGSRLQVAYEAVPYDSMGGGVSLRMKKVRVLDLVEYQSKNDSTDWGEEKGSYVAPKDEFEEEAVDDEEDF
tara:strand:- start:3944 stop:4501 length:558 start_codon:yes stop_codon:yes gene_type:complete